MSKFIPQTEKRHHFEMFEVSQLSHGKNVIRNCLEKYWYCVLYKLIDEVGC